MGTRIRIASAVLSVLFGLKTTLPYLLYFVNVVDSRLWDDFCPKYALLLVQNLLLRSFYMTNDRSISFLHYWHARSSDTHCVQPDIHSTKMNCVWRSLLEVWKELSAFSSESGYPQMWFTNLLPEIPWYIFNGGLSTLGIHRWNKLSDVYRAFNVSGIKMVDNKSSNGRNRSKGT